MRAGILAAGLLAAAALSAVAQGHPAASPAAAGLQPVPRSIITAARAFLGVPYVPGGDSRAGMDCSGLVYRVFHDIVGMDLPRGVEGLSRAGEAADAPLHIGDLLFFDTDENRTLADPSHVGIYAGAGTFVHAASAGPRSGVVVSRVDSPYYRQRFLGARRVFPWRPPVLALTVTDGHVGVEDSLPFPSREALAIDVYNGMTGGGPLDIAVLRDGKVVLTRRIAPGGGKPAEISLVPDAGRWSIRINRIYKGRELAYVSFEVEE